MEREVQRRNGSTVGVSSRCPAAAQPPVLLPSLRPPPCALPPLQANVEGALAAGIPAVRFESAAQLEAELRRRGFHL